MSVRDFLPWRQAGGELDRASVTGEPEAAPAGDAPVDPDRRTFVKWFGMGGLMVATGPFGLRRLDDAGHALAAWGRTAL